jgi:hypothetical protein
MYSLGTKNTYKRTVSSWSNSQDKRKVRHDDSDFDESKSESFFDKVETPDVIKTTLDEMKLTQATFYNELKTLMLNDLKTSTDNTLEYVKSIDSDTKNSIEILEKIDKRAHDENTNDVIKCMHLLHNKTKLNQDQIQCELNTLTSHYDYMMAKIDSIYNHNNMLNNKLNRLTFDYQHVLNELIEINKKLDYLTSHHDYVTKKTNLQQIAEDNNDVTIVVTNEEVKQPEQPVQIVVTQQENKEEIKDDIKEEEKEDVKEEDEVIKDGEQSIFKTTPKQNKSKNRLKK